jgi:hypothetical protein
MTIMDRGIKLKKKHFTVESNLPQNRSFHRVSGFEPDAVQECPRFEVLFPEFRRPWEATKWDISNYATWEARSKR